MQRLGVSTILALVLVCGSLSPKIVFAQERAEKAVKAKVGPHVEGESPRDMCDTAKSDFWHSKINAARFETENGLKRYPKDAPLMTLRGDIELYDCHYAKAVQTYSQALALSPAFADAFGGRGEALMRQGKFAEARKDIEKARSIKPDHFGFVLDQIGNLDYEATIGRPILPRNGHWLLRLLCLTPTAPVAKVWPAVCPMTNWRTTVRNYSVYGGVCILAMTCSTYLRS